MQRRTSLIPHPSHLALPGGTLAVADLTAVAADAEAADLAWILADRLRAGTGHRLPVLDRADGPAVALRLEGDRPDDWTIDAEAYLLRIDAEGVALTAAHPAGLARGAATLLQLLPAAALRAAPAAPAAELPHATVADRPRLRWRGVMLDVARHFQPKDFVLRMIDQAWLHRLNVLHLHLTDDQGWRVEIPSLPRLTEVAAWRSETVIGHARGDAGFDGTPHGGFYTLEDLREINAYARARGITVVPEINLPGHTRAVLAAYPELGLGDGLPVATTFGVFDEVLEPTEDAIAFAAEVFDTVLDVFDSPFVHIGGDEVPTVQWARSETARALMRREGIADVRGVQAWFTRRLTERLTERGRRVIGWDEVLEGGAPLDAIVQVWRSEDYVRKAAELGHEVITSPEPYVYLDGYESADPDEPLRIHGRLTVETIGGWDPVPAGVDPAAVLGAQCQLWTEYLPTPRDVEYAAFPRFAAFADAAWSDVAVRAASPIAERLAGHLERLDALGVNYRPLSGPRPWQRGGTGRRARFDVPKPGAE